MTAKVKTQIINPAKIVEKDVEMMMTKMMMRMRIWMRSKIMVRYLFLYDFAMFDGVTNKLLLQEEDDDDNDGA